MKEVIENQRTDRAVSPIDSSYTSRAIESLSRTDEWRTGPVDESLDRLSFILDQAIRIPGTNIRFGLDPIISLLAPVLGDSITTVLSVYIIIASVRYGLPKGVIARMVFNVGVDYLIGLIPAAGDLFDFAWKANSRNVKLLERHATGDGKSRWSDWAWLFLLLGGLGVFIIGLLAIVIFAIRATGMEFI